MPGRSVLMSLWNVDDTSTNVLVSVLNRHEKLSTSKAQKTRELLLYNDVKHWDPFVLIGGDVILDFQN